MSFILDALKKSEAERQRQTGPTLLELRVTQPRRRYPAWAFVVGALLALNVLVLLVFLLRRTGATAQTAASSAALPTAAAPATTAAPSTAIAASAVTATVQPAPRALPAAGPAGVPAQAGVAEGGAPAAQVATLAAQAASLAAQAAAVAAQVRTPATAPGGVAPLMTPPATATDTGAQTPAAGSGNPADYLPALPASAAGATSTGGGAPQSQAPGDYSGLPSLGELGGNLPALQLNLLDYSDSPGQRYALINMHRVREGDVTAEGARVLAITRQGVALDYHGQRFMLRPAGTVQ